MVFTSLAFLIFFPVVYGLYLLLGRRLRLQNLLLLAASYVFYGFWNWRFLFLIAFSTIVDFTIGWLLGGLNRNNPENRGRRKLLLACSVTVNLGILGIFKYFNFFADSVVSVLGFLGLAPDPIFLRIILPVGISFYTFQTMSYTIDIYRGRLNPTRSLLNFALFVSFFPQLVAGPIERAVNLLPQIEQPRTIRAEQLNNGFFLIIWGYFKKVFVADQVAWVANTVFDNYSDFAGLDIFLGVLAFAIQIYGDFSGYSDIARGISRLLGFELMVNFKLPYFALNPSDFWRRWHISLSTWLRDYLYIPLGGSRKGSLRTNVNLFITMLLGGLWHGAAWNFVIWGAYHGLVLIAYRALRRQPASRRNWETRFASPVVLSQMLLMFLLTLLGWLIFRAGSAQQIAYMLGHVSLVPSNLSSLFIIRIVGFSFPLLLVQLYQYRKRDLLALTKLPAPLQVYLYSLILVLMFILGARQSIEFIYFQF